MLIPSEPQFSIDADKLQRGYGIQVDRAHWIEYPMVVSIETFAKCNAACTFCPYPELDRIGEKLSRETVFRLLDEVAAFPVPPGQLNLTRVNEPFLDPFLFEYIEYARAIMPRVNVHLFTNGQALTDKVIDRLNDLENFKQLTISFNEHDPDQYARVMGLDQAKTLKRLRRLHERVESDEVRFSLAISRVGESNESDALYRKWCEREFPAFRSGINARFNWVGEPGAAKYNHLTPDVGCAQWFTVNILANGMSAFCCIDGSSRLERFSIHENSLYEMYNAPEKRRLREQLVSRRNVRGCEGCIHGMSAAAFQEPNLAVG
ncbi:radical SAM/SPASM domain-containing protein [Parvularcula sp. LCG005]|uniref:radical SAM/SPASM domain-containing protein n=1 Tax=Parvularcula sp. LCG005 TaxID=3078805 RepID=UPI002943B6A0|nr:radical SAM/SPASM domain-containing protein [Parvularcula sp. LCG005]WOI53615.1 radical SAM/SPASM domain-containing protein [Parvularcula sp. LCG005]